ncbi:MAG: DUF2935 domain-containing protein [Bacilli bacterium]|nr:DUF2935 domain-containing protein [Bacilli bacterium]MDD4809059.1 DUF2935 domain-containing protein [Bacilli bacterium]
MKNYIDSSIELHLFYGRIMKEHSLFIEAGFPSVNKDYIDEAEWYKNEFEKLLLETINMSNGYVSPKVLNTDEIVTNHTLNMEEKTEDLTGISINKNITIAELNMKSGDGFVSQTVTQADIKNLNNKAMGLLNNLIDFKQHILDEMLVCRLYNSNYPLMIKHLKEEAMMYRSLLQSLENGQNINFVDKKQEELFWNHIMMEHALFIRGLLDPSESELINIADDFANKYAMLIKELDRVNNTNMEMITNKTYQQTLRFRDFKEAGVKGIDNCEIKSAIIPLLTDHVFREVDHYLRLLKE